MKSEGCEVRVITTVGELRQALDEFEANWTDQDREYLGKFNDQAIRTPYWTKHDSDQRGTYRFAGYGPAELHYDLSGLGFIIEDNEDARSDSL